MELILDTGSQKYYKLDFVVEEGKYGKIDNPTNLIMVSDAHTHIERLVFPFVLAEGFELDDLRAGDQCIHVDYDEIAGDMTFMTGGGNPEYTREPEEYVEELRLLNEKWKGRGEN